MWPNTDDLQCEAKRYENELTVQMLKITEALLRTGVLGSVGQTDPNSDSALPPPVEAELIQLVLAVPIERKET